MSIKIKLVEDQVLLVRTDADAWANAYKHALAENGVIEVHDASGRTLAINPHQILFWEEAPDSEPVQAAAAPQAQPV